MWASCGAGGADTANNLVLADTTAFFHLALVQMQVLGDELFAVLYHHVVAIGLGIARFLHPAIAGGKYGGAPWRFVVDAIVCCDPF